jgi:hypothetical protein
VRARRDTSPFAVKAERTNKGSLPDKEVGVCGLQSSLSTEGRVRRPSTRHGTHFHLAYALNDVVLELALGGRRGKLVPRSCMHRRQSLQVAGGRREELEKECERE